MANEQTQNNSADSTQVNSRPGVGTDVPLDPLRARALAQAQADILRLLARAIIAQVNSRESGRGAE